MISKPKNETLAFTYQLFDLPKRINFETFDRAVFFVLSYLEIYPTLIIEFEKMEFLHCGNSDYFEDEASIIISKRLPLELTIRTLFHEMVHIKQYMDNKLEGGLKLKWLGKEHIGDYRNSPWEIEAYLIEEQIMKEWNK